MVTMLQKAGCALRPRLELVLQHARDSRFQANVMTNPRNSSQGSGEYTPKHTRRKAFNPPHVPSNDSNRASSQRYRYRTTSHLEGPRFLGCQRVLFAGEPPERGAYPVPYTPYPPKQRTAHHPLSTISHADFAAATPRCAEPTKDAALEEPSLEANDSTVGAKAPPQA